MNRNLAILLLAGVLSGCATVAPAVHHRAATPHKAVARAPVVRHEAPAPAVVPVPIAEPAPAPAPAGWHLKWFH